MHHDYQDFKFILIPKLKPNFELIKSSKSMISISVIWRIIKLKLNKNRYYELNPDIETSNFNCTLNWLNDHTHI